MSNISFACLRKVYPVDSLSEDNTTDIKIDPNLAEELEKAGFSDFVKRESIVFEFLGFNGLPTGAYISAVNSDNTMTKTDNKETVRIKFSVLTSGYSIKTVELSDLGGLTQSIEICDDEGNWMPDIITDIVPKVEFRKNKLISFSETYLEGEEKKKFDSLLENFIEGETIIHFIK